MKRLHGPVPRRNYTGLLASLVAIVIGLLLGFLVLALCNPPQAANGIKTLMLGGFTGGMKGLGNVLYYATPIIMTGLGVGLACQTSLFNIGGPGQFISRGPSGLRKATMGTNSLDRR